MAFKLLLGVQGHWRRIDTAACAAGGAGVYFEDGVQVEPQKRKGKKAAA